MSKIINFNNIVLEITGSNEQINDFILYIESGEEKYKPGNDKK